MDRAPIIPPSGLGDDADDRQHDGQDRDGRGRAGPTRSSWAPVTAKKNGVKIWPSGRISCSSSSRASVSATIRPATNAPMIAASPIAAENERHREHHDERRHQRRVREQRPGEDLALAAPGPGERPRTRGRPGPRPRPRRAGSRPTTSPVGDPRDEADEDQREDVVDDGSAKHDPREGPIQDAHLGEHATRDPDAGRRQGQADEGGRRRRLAAQQRRCATPAADRQDHRRRRRSGRPGRPTASRSSRRTSRPTEKSRMTTPISASTNAVSPGVDQPEGARPDDEPAEQLADDGRLAEPARDLLADLRAEEQQEEPEHHLERRGRSVRLAATARRPCDARGDHGSPSDQVADVDVPRRDRARDMTVTGSAVVGGTARKVIGWPARPARLATTTFAEAPDDRRIAAEAGAERERPPQGFDGHPARAQLAHDRDHRRGVRDVVDDRGRDAAEPEEPERGDRRRRRRSPR